MKPQKRVASPKKIQALERRLKALEMRKAGALFEDIGVELGISTPAAFKLVKRSLVKMEARERELAGQLRQMQGARIIDLIAVLWQLAHGRSARTKLEASDRLVKLFKREAELYGLDAPKRQELDVKTAPQITFVLPEEDKE